MKNATWDVLSQCIIEVLEGRQMMSAASLAAGVLTLTGDASAKNQISLKLDVPSKKYDTDVNGKTQAFPASDVERVVIVGGNLADSLIVDCSVKMGVEVDGGAGNDTIDGGNGPDTLDGGAGDDAISGRGGNDVINGGSGNDEIVGGSGVNILSGGGGWDEMSGGYWPDPLADRSHEAGGAAGLQLSEFYSSSSDDFSTVVATGGSAGGVVSSEPPPADNGVPDAPSVPTGDVAPAVKIINPLQGQSNVGPAYYEIRASASDSDGTVKEVDFYNGDVLLGSATAAPFSISWTGVQPGDYTLRAVAIDNDGGGALSAPVQVNVVAPVDGNTIYVSAAASNSGTGTRNNPLASIQKAIDEARPGDTVMVEPGTYRESLVFNQSGTATKPITVEAAQTGTVFIDGADPLSGFTHDAGGDPVYTTAWNHDFFFSGTTRMHGGPSTDGKTTAIGYAEQFIFNGQTLKQVLSKSDLAAGEFYVDYTNQTVSVWLPGGVAPSSGQMLGSTRSTLAAPASALEGDYISLIGLTFQHAANFAQEQAVRTGDGWFMQDCVVQQMNAGGVSVQGNDVVLLRVTGLNNGQLGIGGRKSEDSLLIDCVSKGNNTKGYSPAWEAGSGKFTDTDGAYIQDFTAEDNNGFGLWFDYENTNYVISGGTFTGNHYAAAAWEGVGIMLEISDGPGRVENTNVHDNSGSGLMVGESQNITVQHNTFSNNDVELRDLTRPPSHIYDVSVIDNVFDNTRLSTSQGTWTADSVSAKDITINGNTYDVSSGASLLYWGTLGSLKSLSTIRSELGFETVGSIIT